MMSFEWLILVCFLMIGELFDQCGIGGERSHLADGNVIQFEEALVCLKLHVNELRVHRLDIC